MVNYYHYIEITSFFDSSWSELLGVEGAEVVMAVASHHPSSKVATEPAALFIGAKEFEDLEIF